MWKKNKVREKKNINWCILSFYRPLFQHAWHLTVRREVRERLSRSWERMNHCRSLIFFTFPVNQRWHRKWNRQYVSVNVHIQLFPLLLNSITVSWGWLHTHTHIHHTHHIEWLYLISFSFFVSNNTYKKINSQCHVKHASQVWNTISSRYISQPVDI